MEPCKTCNQELCARPHATRKWRGFADPKLRAREIERMEEKIGKEFFFGHGC